jgi:hypothetical protein
MPTPYPGGKLTLLFIVCFYVSLTFATSVFPFTIQAGLRKKFDPETDSGAVMISLCEVIVVSMFFSLWMPLWNRYYAKYAKSRNCERGV